MFKKFLLPLIILITLIGGYLYQVGPKISSYNPVALGDCTKIYGGTQPAIKCYHDELVKLPLTELSTKMILAEKQGIFKGKCHSVAHLMGQSIAKKYSVNKVVKAKVDLNLCSQGLLHGYLEEVGSEKQSDKLVEVAAQLCNLEETSGCIHGVGHAFSYSKISLSKTSSACVKLTEILTKSKNGTRTPERSLNINCLAGYLMQNELDEPEKYKSFNLTKIINYCNLPEKDIALGCKLALLRIYAKNPLSITEGKVSEFRDLPQDTQRIPKLKEYLGYCSILTGEDQKSCFLYYGMTVADVYNIERLPSFSKEKVLINCKEFNLCYTGYFQIIISQIITNSKDYLKDFCINESCKMAFLNVSGNNQNNKN